MFSLLKFQGRSLSETVAQWRRHFHRTVGLLEQRRGQSRQLRHHRLMGTSGRAQPEHWTTGSHQAASPSAWRSRPGGPSASRPQCCRRQRAPRELWRGWPVRPGSPADGVGGDGVRPRQGPQRAQRLTRRPGRKRTSQQIPRPPRHRGSRIPPKRPHSPAGDDPQASGWQHPCRQRRAPLRPPHGQTAQGDIAKKLYPGFWPST